MAGTFLQSQEFTFYWKCHYCVYKILIKYKVINLARERFVSQMLHLSMQFNVPEHYRGYIPI